MPDPRNTALELARDGTSRIHATLLATRAGVDPGTAQETLIELAGEGAFEIQFEVMCPDNGRTIRTYRAHEAIPFGEEIFDKDADCSEPFVLAPENIWVTFTPTQNLALSELRRQKRETDKKKESLWRAALHRWKELTDSPTTRIRRSISQRRM